MRAMKILVVDDERAVRESLQRALDLEGYEVELAPDGEAALERLGGATQADAVILDVLMPGSTVSRCADDFVPVGMPFRC